MNKICKFHRPHIVWIFQLGPDLHDHVYPNTDIVLIKLMEKYDITYEDMDLSISTEFIEDYDLVFKFSRMFEYGGSFFTINDNECYFAEYFTKHFNITADTENLYMKVIPLPTL